jgi:hypothetical protein
MKCSFESNAHFYEICRNSLYKGGTDINRSFLPLSGKDPPARSGSVSAVGGTEVELPGHRGGKSQRGREVVSLFIDSDTVRGRAGEAHQSDLDAIDFLVGFTHLRSRQEIT